MSRFHPDVLNFVIAWRARGWIVLLGTTRIGDFEAFEDAAELVRREVLKPEHQGQECQVLVHDREGRWHELSCPPDPTTGPPGVWKA